MDINTARVLGGILLVILGCLFLGGARYLAVRNVEFEFVEALSPRRSLIAGLVAISLGLAFLFGGALFPTGDSGDILATGAGASSGGSGGDRPDTSSGSEGSDDSGDTTAPGRTITIDRPVHGDKVTPTCADSCAIELSGSLAASTGSDVVPYALIAYDQEGGADEYWVQYDSTDRDGSTWSSYAYIEGSSPGDSFLLRAVLVRGTVQAPVDPDQGLRWQQALDEQALEVVAESDVARVTIG